MRALRRIGPRPVLLVRYVTFQVVTRLRHRLLRRTYFRTVAGRDWSGSLTLPTLDLPRAGDLPAELQPAAERIKAEADHVVAHRVDYLGSGLTDLGPEIDWQRDFKSGHRWPAEPYWLVRATDLTDDSDAKVPWELSRGHQLLTLARAARLHGGERYARELEAQLESWLDGNPTGVGINWVNAMEVSIRAVNWVWAVGTVELERPLDPALRRRVAASLHAHGRHVAANLEGSPYLRSNHYLADVLGLLVLGWALGEGRWLRLGRRAFEREMRKQVHEDGMAFEASLPYHGLVLEMFLIARVVAGWAGKPLSVEYDERLRLMLEASRAVTHPDGRLPQFGDGDSGRILPSGFDRPPTQRPLQWLGTAVVGVPAPDARPPAEDVAWTLGLAAWETARSAPRATGDERAAFPHGGVYVLRGGGAHAVVRCGDVGQNGNGGHAHNDALSFELSLGRRPACARPRHLRLHLRSGGSQRVPLVEGS